MWRPSSGPSTDIDCVHKSINHSFLIPDECSQSLHPYRDPIVDRLLIWAVCNKCAEFPGHQCISSRGQILPDPSFFVPVLSSSPTASSGQSQSCTVTALHDTTSPAPPGAAGLVFCLAGFLAHFGQIVHSCAFIPPVWNEIVYCVPCHWKHVTLPVFN